MFNFMSALFIVFIGNKYGLCQKKKMYCLYFIFSYIEITVYPALGPSLSKIDIPLSRYSSRDNQNDSLSLVTSPNTAPPINTISLRSGGSSIRILSF